MDENQRLTQLNESRNKEAVEYDYDDIDDDDEIAREEIEEIKINPPQEPLFPIFIFGAAVVKDIIDIVSVGLLGWLAAIILGGIIWLWIFSKSSFLRKQLIKRLIWPIAAAAFVAIFPWLNFIPESSILVYLVYRSEKGIVERTLKKLEETVKILEKLQIVLKI